MFVCLSSFVPLENFLFIWSRHNCRWRSANFDLCSALIAIEQCGFFSVPYLLGHDAPFIMVISEYPWHSHLFRACGSESVTTCLYYLSVTKVIQFVSQNCSQIITVILFESSKMSTDRKFLNCLKHREYQKIICSDRVFECYSHSLDHWNFEFLLQIYRHYHRISSTSKIHIYKLSLYVLWNIPF